MSIRLYHIDNISEADRDKRDYCGSCSNSGFVVLDQLVKSELNGSYCEQGVPCPHCLQGKAHASKLDRNNGDSFWTLQNVVHYSWNNGMDIYTYNRIKATNAVARSIQNPSDPELLKRAQAMIGIR